jgi:hypothetical protein
MKTNLKAELERLSQFTFKRQRLCESLLIKLDGFLRAKEFRNDHEYILRLKLWILTPYSLWPGDFKGFGEYVCQQLDEVKTLNTRIRAILDKVKVMPSEAAQNIVNENEQGIGKGNYDIFLSATAHPKYNHAEFELLTNPEWLKDIEDFSSRYDLSKYISADTGMWRRVQVQERNFRPEDWYFRWTDPVKIEEELAYLEFETLCAKYCLHGIQHSKPLLLKLSVNPTAHGVMIMIPYYWSFDYKRDLNWKAITRLLKARGALRQGPAMSEYRIKRNEIARKVYLGTQESDRLGLIGDARHDFINTYAGISKKTDERTLRYFAEIGQELVQGGPLQMKAKKRVRKGK